MGKHLHRGRLPKARSQSGAALILIMFILGLAIAAYTIKAFTTASMHARQDEETMKELGAAKAALIAWAVNNPEQPGMMPFPDRKETSSPNYDGKSDCYQYNLDGKYDKLIGNLPWLAMDNAGCNNFVSGLGHEFRDSSGEHLWYAVSRNLVYAYVDSEYPVINPGMINSPYIQPPYLRQGGTTAYPWLTVADANGVTLSDRVAAIIIAPGDPIGNQDRSGVANPDQYLDKIIMAGGTQYKNFGYPLNNLDIQKFIIGENENIVSATDPRYQHPYHFNDKLVYITIDELMAALEKRVTAEAKNSIRTYFKSNSSYPYAAQLGSTSQYACEPDNKEGFLPLDNQICGYTATPSGRSLDCTLPMFDTERSGILEVRLTLSGLLNVFIAKDKSCEINGLLKTCSCSGAGSCSTLTGSFICDGEKNCTSNGVNGTYNIEGGKFSNASGACSVTSPATKTADNCTEANSVVSCGFSASLPSKFSSCGDATFGADLPSWFRANRWQDYIYYVTSRTSPGNITAGSRASVEALLIATGRAIQAPPYTEAKSTMAQVRPSCSAINDYLDSIENTNSGLTFDAISKERSNNYNDQLFIVAP